MRLTAAQPALDAHADRLRRAATITAAVSTSIAVVILVIEYRLMLIALIVLAAPAIAITEAVRARRAAADGPIDVALARGVLSFERHGERLEAPASTAIVRAQRDALVLSVRPTPNEWRMYTVPADPTAVSAAAAALRHAGVRVNDESGGTSWVIVALGFGVLAIKALGVVAAVLVTAAVANVASALMGGAGSLVKGALYFGGAVVCLLPAAILRAGAGVVAPRR